MTPCAPEVILCKIDLSDVRLDVLFNLLYTVYVQLAGLKDQGNPLTIRMNFLGEKYLILSAPSCQARPVNIDTRQTCMENWKKPLIWSIDRCDARADSGPGPVNCPSSTVQILRTCGRVSS